MKTSCHCDQRKKSNFVSNNYSNTRNQLFLFQFFVTRKKVLCHLSLFLRVEKKSDSGGGQDRDQGGAREVRLTVQYIDGPTRFNQAVGAKQFVTSMKQHRAEIQLH